MDYTQGREFLCHFPSSILINIGPNRLEGKTEIFLVVASAYKDRVSQIYVVWIYLANSCIAVPVPLWFAFSELWPFKPTADVKIDSGFPKFSMFDGNLVRPLKPQRRMGGEGVLWTARHCGERRWLFGVSHSESPLNPSTEMGKHGPCQGTVFWTKQKNKLWSCGY